MSESTQDAFPAAPPGWLDEGTLRLMVAASDRALAWGRDALAAAEAAREIITARRPALPAPMLHDAVAAVVPEAAGRPTGAPALDGETLTPAGTSEVAEALSYALRFGLDGKPRRAGHAFLAPLAAAHLVQYLTRSRFVVMRRSALPSRCASHQDSG